MAALTSGTGPVLRVEYETGRAAETVGFVGRRGESLAVANRTSFTVTFLLYSRTSLWPHSLTRCGRVTQICVFNTVKLGTSASSP